MDQTTVPAVAEPTRRARRAAQAAVLRRHRRPQATAAEGEQPAESWDEDGPEISVVVPVYNEVENIGTLVPALFEVMDGLRREYEIIVVDDGSRDGTFQLLEQLHQQFPALIVIRFRTNYGQTAALSAGFRHSRGEWVVTLDGDLQNDPADIPRLLEKTREGFDVVSGWRHRRQDAFWHRKLPSMAANFLISRMTGVQLHDYGCTLKVYRGEMIRDLSLYGELHRFIPALATWLGARVAEIPVNHLPRHAGTSKYGLSRVYKVFLDLLTVKFLLHFANHPIRVFGGFGLLSFLAGTLSGATVLMMKLALNFSLNRNPLLYMTIFLFTVGFQFILMGLLAELMVRSYHDSSGRPTYHIAEVLE